MMVDLFADWSKKLDPRALYLTSFWPPYVLVDIQQLFLARGRGWKFLNNFEGFLDGKWVISHISSVPLMAHFRHVGYPVTDESSELYSDIIAGRSILGHA